MTAKVVNSFQNDRNTVECLPVPLIFGCICWLVTLELSIHHSPATNSCYPPFCSFKLLCSLLDYFDDLDSLNEGSAATFSTHFYNTMQSNLGKNVFRQNSLALHLTVFKRFTEKTFKFSSFWVFSNNECTRWDVLKRLYNFSSSTKRLITFIATPAASEWTKFRAWA